MEIVCLDLEGVLVPEIWINFAKRTGIKALEATTRDIPDYDVLMQQRLRILDEHKLGLGDIQDVIASMGPLPGAPEFVEWVREHFQLIILSDTFYEFAHPLMRQLGWPTIMCHKLETSAEGRITNYVLRQPDQKREAVKALHGLNRALLQNAVLGVTEGFKREIDLVGIGFKAEVKGREVVFSVGFSHQVKFPMPEGIKIDVAPDAKAKDVTHVIVTGVDKQKVGQTATEIRGIRPPDPYKLKGFRFVGEVLKKKAGKAGATGAK